MSRLTRLEAFLTMFIDIGISCANRTNIEDLLKQIHDSLHQIMYAANFYVVLTDAERRNMRFVYSADEQNPDQYPADHIPIDQAVNTPTLWVIHHGLFLVMTAAEDRKRIESGEWLSGESAQHWMGAPLKSVDGRVIGVMALQSYDALRLYSDEDQALFQVIANHLSMVLQSQNGAELLERAVQARTKRLRQEVADHKQAATLQSVLYQIADLSVSSISPSVLYQRIHALISELMVANNFLIAFYHPETKEISMQYFVDEMQSVPEMTRFPLGIGMTSYVVRSRQPQLIDAQRLASLIEQGEIAQVLGNQTHICSWMGAPLIARNSLYGVIVVQSYSESNLYDESDLALLAFVASHVATALGRIEAERELVNAKVHLENQNRNLNEALAELKLTQSELVRKEKLASLGGLVAGIAHEINTPLGICVTATSHLQDEIKLLQKELAEETLDLAGLENYLATCEQGLTILDKNTARAAKLVNSFKRVAVDQTSDEIRVFNLHQYLNEILLSLKPEFRHRDVDIGLQCPSDILIKNCPGAFAQMITNMIMNSLHHAFEGTSTGKIRIRAEAKETYVELIYYDDGRGMDESALAQLFDPFYTTKRGLGGSGLGAHIIFNIVTSTFGGQINASSEVGKGLRYDIKLPVHYRDKK